MASLQDQLKALLMSARAPQADAAESAMPGPTPGLPFMNQAPNQSMNQSMISPSNPPEQPQIDPISQDPVSSPLSAQALPAPGFGVLPTGAESDPKLKELQNMLRDKIAAGQQKQEQNIDLNRAMLMGQLGKKQGVDLSGGYAVARMLGAKDAGEGYKAPEDVTKGAETALGGLTKAQQALSDDQINQLKAELNNRLLQQSVGAQRNQIMQDRMDRNEHMKIIGDVKKDPISRDYAGKMNAIDRSNILLDKAKNVTTASLEEYQQGIRSALTNIKGSGGVGERAETYIKTLDMQIAKIQQAFGDLDSIPKDHPLVIHLRDLADHAQNVISQQLEKRMTAVAGGRKSLYGRRPDLLGDLDELKTQMKDSAAPEGDFSAAEASNPHKNSLGSDTATANSKPKTVTQNGNTYTLNQKTGMYE